MSKSKNSTGDAQRIGKTFSVEPLDALEGGTGRSASRVTAKAAWLPAYVVADLVGGWLGQDRTVPHAEHDRIVVAAGGYAWRKAVVASARKCRDDAVTAEWAERAATTYDHHSLPPIWQDLMDAGQVFGGQS